MKSKWLSALIIAQLTGFSAAALSQTESTNIEQPVAITPDELIAFTKVSVDKFSKEKPEHLPHFVGYKAWKSGTDGKIKIYVSHDGMNMEFNYTCHRHDQEGVECHAQ